MGRPRRRHSLTCADSDTSVVGGSEVTVEAFVRVTDVFLRAELAHLFGTNPAAAAAVQHQAHSWGALGWVGGAGTLAAALLSCSLRKEAVRYQASCSASIRSESLQTQSEGLPWRRAPRAEEAAGSFSSTSFLDVEITSFLLEKIFLVGA